MSKIKDYSNQKINKWTLLRFDRRQNHNTYWNAICECGTEKIVHYGNQEEFIELCKLIANNNPNY